MKISRFLLLLVFIPVITAQAQVPACIDPDNSYSQWYFGNKGGLDFTSGAPVVNSASMINATNGVTSIADPNGKVLFYSNGTIVWDSTNAVMLGGTGLAGSGSYSQNALAVPVPGDPAMYYLLTNGPSGVQYSVIDMTANGGKGEVISKNNALLTNTTQKLSAVADGSGGVWIVSSSPNSNQFDVVKLTAAGFGPVVTQNTGTVQTDASGTLKFSKDGTKVAITLPGQSTIEVYDFDKVTGTLSASPVATLTEPGVYDVEFSPDNSRLYSVNTSGGELAQFDLTAGTNAAIQSSKTVLSNVGSTYYNALKVGPDGKIYVSLGKAGDGYIGVINDPNTAGTGSNYVHQAITMTPGTTSQYGFPNSVANYTNTPAIAYSNTCARNNTEFFAQAYGDASGWTWDFGDGTTGTGTNPSHTYAGPGTYTVTLSYPNSCGSTTTITQTVTIDPNPVNIKLRDTVVCDTPYVMNAGNPGATYLWSNGATTQTTGISAAGKYWAKVTLGGCTDADTANIRVWGQGNKGNYQWYFGSNAGLDFNNNPASVITTNADNTKGGTSSIADPLGKLLFYTDGINVYDKNNNPMPGGTGLNGTGDTSQSVLIVPHPAANNFYYVFTVNPDEGLNYSVVDLSYNNGLGKVTETNIPLHSPVSGKIAGVKNDNGDFWVVTRESNSNKFVAYKVDTTGLASTPVISAVGTSETDGQGYLKFSEDGTKAAVAIQGSNTVEIYDFDKNSGTFSNPVTITNVTNPFGVEFSSSNNKLYVSTDGDGHIYQYDITSGDATTIMATQKLISDDPSVSYEAMQMGPDGRIYIALEGSGSGYLAVINNPDLDSTEAAFQNKIVSLGTQSNSGLPNFVANHFKFSDWGIQDADTCFSMLTQFLASAPDTVYSWTWDFGEPSSASNSATGQMATHQYAAPGTYHVSVTAVYPCGTKVLTKDVTIVPFPTLNLHDTTVCTASELMLDAGNPGAQYLWSTGAQTRTIKVNADGAYSVLAVIAGCADTATANVTFAHINSISLGNDTTLCSGNTLNLDPGPYPGGTFKWSTGATGTQTVPVTTSGTYYLDVISYSYCKASDTINVTFIPKPVVSFGAPPVLCEGDTKVLDAGSYPGYTYLWSDNSSGQQLTVTTSGTYGVKVFQGSCAGGDTITLTFNPLPVVSLPSEQTLCSQNGDTIVLNGGTSFSYLWMPGGETTQTINATAEGIYTLEASTAAGCKRTVSTLVKDICEALLFVPNIFSPNGDGSNDEFIVHGKGIVQYKLEIFDRWGELIFVSEDMSRSWDGKYRGNIVQEGAYIWKISYTGETVKGTTESRVHTGDVTVIR